MAESLSLFFKEITWQKFAKICKFLDPPVLSSTFLKTDFSRSRWVDPKLLFLLYWQPRVAKFLSAIKYADDNFKMKMSWLGFNYCTCKSTAT